MKTYQKCSIIVMASLVMLSLTIPCFSAIPGWKNVPEKLKHGFGVLSNGNFIYATGISCIGNIRPDMAHEVAQEKSLLRALQIASLFGSCNFINENLEGEEQVQFYMAFAPMAKKVKFQGVQVIRQWEKKDCNYTTIAIPENEIEKIPCEFTDIKSAVLKYLEYGYKTQSGLLFCLKNTDQYSQLRRQVEIAFEKLLIEQGEVAALCFSSKQDQGGGHKLIENVSMQNRIYRANKLVDTIKKNLSQKGDLTSLLSWKESLVELVSAIELAPENGKPYLLLADWANNFYDPIVAKYAYEKAMRDGIYLKEALTRKVSYLNEIRSDEKDILNLLLSQLVKVPDDWLIACWSETLPKTWNAALRIMKDNPVANLVAASLGQAIRSEPRNPPSEFAQAISLYNKSDSNDDLVEVLKILFKACEKEPASPEVYNLIGACFRHMGQYEMALPFLWQALVLKPGFDLPLTNLGLSCEKLNSMKSAGYYFNHDAVVNSSNTWVKSSYTKFISRGKQ